MKVATWNVNSIRTRLERCLAFLERHQPDVLCLQELKVREEDFPAAAFAERGWQAAVFGQPTYNGVAVLSRQPMREIARGFPGDPVPDQARVLGVEVAGLAILDLYVVNGEAVGSPKYATKLAWLDALAAWLETTWRPADPLLLVGDFNVAPEDRDVHDPERWHERVLCSSAERQRLRHLLDWGLEDLFRRHCQEGGHYTWWDYRQGAFHRGWGLRIDLALGTAPVAARCTGVVIDREERKPSAGPGKPSDHAPVLVSLAD